MLFLELFQGPVNLFFCIPVTLPWGVRRRSASSMWVRMWECQSFTQTSATLDVPSRRNHWRKNIQNLWFSGRNTGFLPDTHAPINAVDSISGSALTFLVLSYCYQSWRPSTTDACAKPGALLAPECLLIPRSWKVCRPSARRDI